MHGREGEERKPRRHMWPVPALGTTVGAADSTTSVTSDSFCKDGRKISVGDCALFKPQQETSPPFIGIIRWLTSNKESYLKLGVNWLYRPADVKLGKGVWLEAAPNEIFYSFHKDEIPAASLLHPCKVAFLRKGVELPPGISSFVCRRVYDPSNKRLWWLTDQDYLNERQEEVDQLLLKTRLEMHAAVQSGGRSPKPLNSPSSTPQLKQGSDSAQNSPNSFSSQSKGKKRDRGDQGSECVKRERSSKTDDGNGYFRPESMLKSEIAKITDKGGLVDYEGVERLVQLMQPDRFERKIDLAGRIMLADVITVTDKYDCLGKFVELRGLSVLDEWLQEVHKGKIGDGGMSKESEKPVEEFLFALLRALDKLPVDLFALQTSNVGKSVNLLRSHKNLEIQKKARGLVDTWKRRVEAEMNMTDVKSGSTQAVSWPNKGSFPEVSHGGSKRIGGSSELPVKNSIAQPSAKSVPVKPGPGDSTAKLMAASPGSMKVSSALPASVAVSRDSPCKTALGSGASDTALTARDEKSSSSSQSQNNSQSCSSDHTKLVSSSWKEDARSSTAGSVNVNKTSSGATRHRKSSNGVVGSSVSGSQKDNMLVKCSSVDRKAVAEKVPHELLCEKADVPPVDHGNNHRLIVRIPNPGRSPARSGSGGGSFDDHHITVSQACSPGFPDKRDHCERRVKVRSDTLRSNISADMNTESWQRNDVKDGLAGSDEADGSAAVLLDDEHGRAGNEDGKKFETSKSAYLSSGYKGDLLNETKLGKSHEASLRSINVLIDSCVKYSESNTSLPIGDDRGMNLLASVAAGEISKSELVPSVDSPGRSPVPGDSPTENGEKRSSREEVAVRSEDRSDNSAGVESVKKVSLQVKKGEQHLVKHASSKSSEDSSKTSSFTDRKSTGEHSEQFHCSSMDLQQSAGLCIKSDGKPHETATISMATSKVEKSEDGVEGEGANQLHDSRKTSLCNAEEKIAGNGVTAASASVCSSVDACDMDVAAVAGKMKKEAVEKLSSGPLVERESEYKNLVHEVSGAGILTEHKPSPILNCNVAVKEDVGDATPASGSGNVLIPNNMVDLKDEKVGCVEARSHVEEGVCQKMDWARTASSSKENCVAAGMSSIVSDQNNVLQENSESKEVLGGSVPNEALLPISAIETTNGLNSSGPKLSDVEENELKDCVSTVEAPPLPVAAEPDTGGKLDFDLNEGLDADEGNSGDPVVSVGPGSPVVHMHVPLSYPLSSLSNGLPASVTVAAAAKGPFVPPENLLRPSGEIGWKGSAATSAFRPAEPRKVLEMPLGASESPPDTAASKLGRPPLDIDLNVPGDRVLEDLTLQSTAQMTGSESNLDRCPDVFGSSAPTRSFGGLDLDLNKVNEDTDIGQFSASTSHRLEGPSVRSSSSGGYSNGEVNVLRNFDLNNGPCLDEVGSESAQPRQHAKSGLPFLPPVASIRMNNTELGSLSPWFPHGNSYPAVSIPPILPDREQPYPVVSTAATQRILGPTGAISFGSDVYKGPVLSSSPAVAFTPANAFSYPGFPFGASFPLPSATFSNGSAMCMDSSSGGGLCFPAVPSQLVGGGSTVSSHYPRPYVISLPDGTPNGAESSRKWTRQGLDLNAGPGGTDIDGRDERLLSASRQHPVTSSQVLAEEQVRMYQAASTVLKRNEPEGGWDAERYNYRQPSWQQ